MENCPVKGEFPNKFIPKFGVVHLHWDNRCSWEGGSESIGHQEMKVMGLDRETWSRISREAKARSAMLVMMTNTDVSERTGLLLREKYSGK